MKPATRRLAQRLVLQAKRELWGLSIGAHEAKARGPGMAFSEARAYQPGDDLRAVDWKATARLGRPFVKLFAEERERTIWLLVDTSASMSAPRRGEDADGPRTKPAFVRELVGLLAMVAAARADRVGLATFGPIGAWREPKSGDRWATGLVSALDVEANAPGLGITESLTRLCRGGAAPSVIFAISDWLEDGMASALGRARPRHEVVAIGVVDPWEEALPARGLVRFADAESGQRRTIDTMSPPFQSAYRQNAKRRRERLRREIARFGVPFLAMTTNRSPVSWLLRYFSR